MTQRHELTVGQTVWIRVHERETVQVYILKFAVNQARLRRPAGLYYPRGFNYCRSLDNIFLTEAEARGA